MRCPKELSEVMDELSIRFPHLNQGLVKGLGWWVYGMMAIQRCSLTSIAYYLTPLVGANFGAVRQCLREFYCESEAKRGSGRSELEVAGCTRGLIRWILEWWHSDEQRLVLALDATSLGQRFCVLVVAIVYRGIALPIAWRVLPAATVGAWRPQWEGMLAEVAPHLPQGWQILVTADRGLYAKWLYEQVCRYGWHPFFRIQAQGYFFPDHASALVLSKQMIRPGQAWVARGRCFKYEPILTTLVVAWEAGYTDPWLIVTDLTPDGAWAGWYAMRAWIEQLFKRLKRSGWHWEQTKMRDPVRAQRLWLVMALGTLMLVGDAGITDPDGLPPDAPLPETALTCAKTVTPVLGLFRVGLLRFLADLQTHTFLVRGLFRPRLWPHPDTIPALRTC